MIYNVGSQCGGLSCDTTYRHSKIIFFLEIVSKATGTCKYCQKSLCLNQSLLPYLAIWAVNNKSCGVKSYSPLGKHVKGGHTFSLNPVSNHGNH